MALAIGILLFTLNSCKKEAEHYVRFKNNYKETIVVAKLDAISFGQIPTNTASDYKYVFPGSFTVTIETKSGQKAEGTAKLSGGSGKYNWTLTLDAKGQITSSLD